MALNPEIALQGKGLQLNDPLQQYAQVAQIQGAQNQNQVSQMQIAQMQRDEATMQQIQAKAVEHGGPSDLNEIANAYMNSGNHKFVEFGVGLRQKLDEKAQFDSIMGGTPAPASTAAPAMPTAQYPQSATASSPYALGSGGFGTGSQVNNLATPATPSVNNLASPDVSKLRTQRNALLGMGTPQAIAAARALDADITLAAKEVVYHNVPGVGLVDPRTGRVITPSVEPTQSDIKQYEYSKLQGYKGSFFEFKRDMATAGRTPAQPRAEQPPVAVIDPASGKQIYVSREEALRNRMTPASAMESIAPKEIQKREAALPVATAAIKGFEDKSDIFISDLEKLRDHIGLEQITGPIYGRTGSVSKEGSAAQAMYDKVVAKGGFQALQDLRDASKTGGALGNISNQEGSQLKASFAAIDRRQNSTDVKAAINDAIASVQGAKTRTREAYDSTYSYKSVGSPALATTGKTNVVVTPDGQSHTFPTPGAAAQFKKAAGL